MNHEVPRTSWVLWAVALFGLVLWLSHGGKAAPPAGGGRPAPAPPVSGVLAATLAHVLAALLWALAALLLLALLVAAVRLALRRRRALAMRVDEIILGPDDTATPYEVMSALDAIHGQLLTRYGSAALGQVSWTFEIVRDADGGVHFLLAAPFGWLDAIEDIWRSKYTNLRFRPWRETPRPWPVAQQIVLAKPWWHATETQKDYQNSVVETLVQALDRADGAVHLQYHLTPLPVEPLHAQLRHRIRQMEYGARAQQQADPAMPGVGYAESQVVKDSLQLYGKAAFRTEIRLAADTWADMQRAYGAIQEAGGENRFRAATVVLGKGLWTRWFWARMPSLVLFRACLLFSFPLATLIHLPTARLRVNSLQRALVRRGPAPRPIPRDPALAILRDETGPVGIPEGDRKYNLLLVGSQGAGKTTDLLNVVKVDSRWTAPGADGRPVYAKALVLLDIGKDTAHRALGIIPPGREVIWFDPADPACPWGINPLLADVEASGLADHVLEGLTAVFGDEAIRARSREFLGNAILAVREVLGDQADFTHVYRLLTDETFRQYVAEHVQDAHQRRYWQQVIPQTLQVNPRFFEEGLAAPRNKLDEVLRNPRIRAVLEAGPGRRLIDFRAIIARRQILVANLDKARLGTTGARLVGILLLTMLWHALEAQTAVPEAERVPVSLILDEAQNFISDGFLDLLAEGRAYGVQVTLAVRFLQEIASEKVILGLQALAQNLIVHQFELVDEAKLFMQRFMRVWANMVTTADESQDAINFGADDFMRLPKFWAVCRFMVGGTPQPAFLAQTIPWETAYDAAARQAHLARQPQWTPPPEPVGKSAPAEDVKQTAEPEPARTVGSPGPDAEAERAPTPARAGSPLSGADLPGAAPGVGPPGLPDVLTLLLGPEGAAALLAFARDKLTGLYGQNVWHQLLAQDLTACAVVICDLDGLKPINDTQGHAAGDAYLQRAARALAQAVGSGGLAVRAGGDEFAVLARGLSPGELAGLEARIRAALLAAGVEASVGSARQEPGESLAAAVARADAAMYADKRQRKGELADAAEPTDPAAADPASPADAIPPPTVPRTPSPDPADGPALWEPTDPRQAACRRYGWTPDQMRQWAAAAGATPEEVREAAAWLLRNKVPPHQGAAQARFRRVLALKAEDRRLRPLAERLGADLGALREALWAAEASVDEVLAVAAAHPEVTTMDRLMSLVHPPAGGRQRSRAVTRGRERS
ncbi:MAG: diguanylate cyclase [Actinomycetia bacterium]|nr:diguanylate cyclase [Actinomycetes bacterium]